MFTSDHALKLDWIPNWIAIIGSGYIGLEFSDVYTALGSEVTFVEVGGPVCMCSRVHTRTHACMMNLTCGVFMSAHLVHLRLPVLRRACS